MKYSLDRSVSRYDATIVGGSPLRLFRLTAAGMAVFDTIAGGGDVDGSELVDRLLDAGAIHPAPEDPGPFSRVEVTIVVPVHGLLPVELAAKVVNAIVVDDASPVPVAGAALRFEHNRGPAAARNAGLDHVTTPLVAFVDADVTLPDGWLDGLLPLFSDPTVGLVAPRVASRPGPSRLDRYEMSSSPLDLGPQPARIRAGTRVGYVPAAVIVCRTDAVRGVGGFDEGLRFGEDVDLVWRLDEAGWRCRYQPSVVAHHAPRSGWGDWARQRVDYGSSAAPLSLRHPRALAPLRTSGWSAFAWALAVLRRPTAAFAVGVGSAAALVPKLPDVPPRDAFRLAAVGNLRAGAHIADAVRRAWWPVVAVLAVRSRAARLVLAGSLVTKPPIGAADDLAYSVGLWRGVIRRRTIRPLVPQIAGWPGRSPGKRRNRYRATA